MSTNPITAEDAAVMSIGKRVAITDGMLEAVRGHAVDAFWRSVMEMVPAPDFSLGDTGHEAFTKATEEAVAAYVTANYNRDFFHQRVADELDKLPEFGVRRGKFQWSVTYEYPGFLAIQVAENRRFHVGEQGFTKWSGELVITLPDHEGCTYDETIQFDSSDIQEFYCPKAVARQLVREVQKYGY